VRQHPLHKKKNILTFSNIKKITRNQFTIEKLAGTPNVGELPQFKKEGKKYDDIIRGWTNYWNNIFKPSEPLDPDLVKALIGSESSFKLNPKDNPLAFGLMQITETSSHLGGSSSKL